MKNKILPLIGIAVMLSGAPLLQSCSSSQSTTTTTAASPDPNAPPEVAETSTTTTTTTTDNEPDSVLGATFHAIGTIIAFPFRLIGDALGLIF